MVGPLNASFCDVHNILKNFFSVCIMLTMDCIIVLRYIFISAEVLEFKVEVEVVALQSKHYCGLTVTLLSRQRFLPRQTVGAVSEPGYERQ